MSTKTKSRHGNRFSLVVLPVDEALAFFRGLDLPGWRGEIATKIVKPTAAEACMWRGGIWPSLLRRRCGGLLDQYRGASRPLSAVPRGLEQ